MEISSPSRGMERVTCASAAKGSTTRTEANSSMNFATGLTVLPLIGRCLRTGKGYKENESCVNESPTADIGKDEHRGAARQRFVLFRKTVVQGHHVALRHGQIQVGKKTAEPHACRDLDLETPLRILGGEVLPQGTEHFALLGSLGVRS